MSGTGIRCRLRSKQSLNISRFGTHNTATELTWAYNMNIISIASLIHKGVLFTRSKELSSKDISKVVYQRHLAAAEREL